MKKNNSTRTNTSTNTKLPMPYHQCTNMPQIRSQYRICTHNATSANAANAANATDTADANAADATDATEHATSQPDASNHPMHQCIRCIRCTIRSSNLRYPVWLDADIRCRLLSVLYTRDRFNMYLCRQHPACQPIFGIEDETSLESTGPIPMPNLNKVLYRMVGKCLSLQNSCLKNHRYSNIRITSIEMPS